MRRLLGECGELEREWERVGTDQERGDRDRERRRVVIIGVLAGVIGAMGVTGVIGVKGAMGE